MSKPTLYMMLGYPGAGKTTSAEIIANLTGAVHLNSDKFRLHMFKKPKFTQTEHDYIYRSLDYVCELILASGKSVIYDANLNRYVHRQEKYEICKRVGAEVKLIWVKTGESLARRRATIDGNKNPAHRPYGNLEETVFKRLVDNIEEPRASEPATLINGAKIAQSAIKLALAS